MNEPRPAMISARPSGDQVERREVLEDAHGIVGGEHADRAGQPDALGARGRRGQHDRGRGDGELRPVVLAHAEDVEPDLVGELDLLEQVRHPLLDGEVRVGQLAERVDAELHLLGHRLQPHARPAAGAGPAARRSAPARPRPAEKANAVV